MGRINASTSQSRVMSDIYGRQDAVLLQNGLADAEDECDFDAKLESLKPVWEEIAPGFHHWFKSNRSKLFKDCLVLSARENLSIEGRFYMNGVKLKHKLQKKRMAKEDVPKEIAAVIAQLFTWAEEFYLEEERAIQGLGKYRLAPIYNEQPCLVGLCAFALFTVGWANLYQPHIRRLIPKVWAHNWRNFHYIRVAIYVHRWSFWFSIGGNFVS